MSTAAAALSGNFNATVDTPAVLLKGGVKFRYDGTTLGMTLSALEAGAQVGDVIMTNGLFRGTTNRHVVVASGGGDRTPGGVWVERSRA